MPETDPETGRRAAGGRLVVTIDGPAGAGKGTVARAVAAALGLDWLDTGAMYRAVAWRARCAGLDARRVVEVAALAENTEIRFEGAAGEGEQRVLVDNQDVTGELRLPEVSSLTSAIATIPAVRRALVARQRAVAASFPRGVVAEGRDTGTVVFPGADVKVFLTASPEERARRRVADLRRRGVAADYASVLRDQRDRDARDSERSDSPLAAPAGSLTLNTDGLTREEVAQRVLAFCRSQTCA